MYAERPVSKVILYQRSVSMVIFYFLDPGMVWNVVLLSPSDHDPITFQNWGRLTLRLINEPSPPNVIPGGWLLSHYN